VSFKAHWFTFEKSSGVHPVRKIILVLDLAMVALAAWLWVARPTDDPALPWFCLALVFFASVGLVPFAIRQALRARAASPRDP
jgi:hypothetical protein